MIGTFLHLAHEEGLIRNTSIHAGIRAPLIRPKGDLRNDLRCGFEIIKARDIDRIGVSGVIEKLKERVGNSRVYISVDIDVLDPAFAPGKATCIYLLYSCWIYNCVTSEDGYLDRANIAMFVHVMESQCRVTYSDGLRSLHLEIALCFLG